MSWSRCASSASGPTTGWLTTRFWPRLPRRASSVEQLRRRLDGLRPAAQPHDEGGACPGLALDEQRSLVRTDDLGADVEPEPEPTEVPRRHRAFEASEDALLVFLGDPDAVVAHDDLDVIVGGLGAHVDRAA